MVFQMSLRHPLAPEADSGMTVPAGIVISPNKIGGSPRDNNVPALADSTKSPNTCLSPSLNPFASRVETSDVNSTAYWNQGFQQGLEVATRQLQQGSQPRPVMSSVQVAETAARPVVLETKSDSLSRGLDRDDLVGDSDRVVPVIISLGDKSKKSVTAEIQIQDIANGAMCTLEGRGAKVRVACEQQTHFRSSLLSLRKKGTKTGNASAVRRLK